MTDTDVIKLLLTLIAAGMGAVVMFLLKAVFDNRKSSGDTLPGSTTKGMMVRDLHDWHKPDAVGRQDWKNPEIREQMQQISTAIEKQTNEMHSGQTKIVGTLDKMHDTFTGLREDLSKLKQ